MMNSTNIGRGLNHDVSVELRGKKKGGESEGSGGSIFYCVCCAFNFMCCNILLFCPT